MEKESLTMERETARLRMREFTAEDWAAVRAYQDEPNYLRFYDAASCTDNNAKAFVQQFLDQQNERPRTRFQLVLTLKSGGNLVGNCGIRISDRAGKEASLGYELDSRHWGFGYATEAAREMLRFGFKTLNLHRIWAECLAENAASERVLQKLGLRQEAYFQEKERVKGFWRDQFIYAILEREWRARRNQEGK